jgi:hypothetical protein
VPAVVFCLVLRRRDVTRFEHCQSLARRDVVALPDEQPLDRRGVARSHPRLSHGEYRRRAGDALFDIVHRRRSELHLDLRLGLGLIFFRTSAEHDRGGENGQQKAFHCPAATSRSDLALKYAAMDEK